MWIVSKPIAGNTLLIVIFHEMKHLRPNIGKGYLYLIYPIGGVFIADDIPQRIIQTYLIIECIHLTYMQVIAVAIRVVDLSHKESVRTSALDIGVQVAPELHGHHLCHIVPKAIYP